MIRTIAKLWSIIYDLLLFAKGESSKSLEQIEQDIDIAEFNCRKYEVNDRVPRDTLPFENCAGAITERKTKWNL